MGIARSNSRSPGPRGRLLATALASAVVLLPGLSHAQSANVIQRSFINLSFEVPQLASAGCRLYIDEAAVPGWTTSHPPHAQGASAMGAGSTCLPYPQGYQNGVLAPIIELWRTPRSGVTARSGQQLAELNAERESRISQNVCLEQGDEVRWQFSHRGRESATRQDQMEFLVGTTAIVSVGTTNDGTGGVITRFLGTATSIQAPGNTTWRDYSGTFDYQGASGPTNIGFEAIPVPGGSPTGGNFLDDIQVFLKPVIELTGGTYETMEGTVSDVPTLRIVGYLETDLEVQVTVTGGTAVLGTDFLTPNDALTFPVRIAARATPYEGELIPLGLSAPSNTDFDGTRSVTLRLEANDAEYFTRSTSSCGDDGIATATWNILDDDVDLSMTKTVSPEVANTGDTVTFTLTASSDPNAQVDANNAVIRDPAVVGLDCSAAVPTCTPAGNATCPADVSIATLQGAGALIPVFPPGGSVTVSFSCLVTATP